MVDKRKIFVGSSTEALRLSDCVGELIDQADMEPVIWKGAFSTGANLLEAIENLPNNIHGAVLLWTPDVDCARAGAQFGAPVANVVFEYGYLAARLTRKRVVICQFEGADIPSDFRCLLYIPSGKYEPKTEAPLPDETQRQLRVWLNGLPSLVEEISPIHQVHAYSGKWEVETHFARWRNYELKKQDEWVTFLGTTLLLIPIDGQNGSGTQIGELEVSIGNYKATYQVANQVDRVDAAESGNLNMHIRVVSRKLIREKGKPPEPGLRGDLPGHQQFELEGEPVKGGPRVLKVKHHVYLAGETHYQEATEDWKYLGF